MEKKPILWIVGAIALVVAVGLFAFTSGSISPAAQPLDETPVAESAEAAVAPEHEAEQETEQTAESSADESAADTVTTDTVTTDTVTTETVAIETVATDAVTIDVAAALADRTMGHPDAPVVMHEFASLTCGHCADFSKKTFDRIRETYIDTGKVYFVYHDFPLNAPALEAAMIARCLPETRYFAFIKYLFDTQEKWTAGDYKTNLRQNARLVGMSDARFEACINNEELKLGLIEKMQEAGQRYNISSTPSFVFNNGVQKLNGSQPFDSYRRTIDGLLKDRE